jgi:hypothetical protein
LKKLPRDDWSPKNATEGLLTKKPKSAMEVVLDKNYGIDAKGATLATMEIKAEIGRRLVAKRTDNIEKQDEESDEFGV